MVIAGVALIVGGLVIISWEGSERSWKRTELIFPFLAAGLFAVKDVTVRWGLGGSGSPILAAGIAAPTSTVEILLINRYVHKENSRSHPNTSSIGLSVPEYLPAGHSLSCFSH